MTCHTSKSPLGLIGGDAMQRTVLACRLRRCGVPVHSELQNRKRSRMLDKAREEAETIYDLDRVEDQEEICWLIRGLGA